MQHRETKQVFHRTTVQKYSKS